MGGALLQSLAGESASGEHYTTKVNFRRDQEGEVRREGWDLFTPSGKFLEALPQIASDGSDITQSFDPIRLICQFRSNDYVSCLVVAAGDKLYRYKYEDEPEYLNKTGDWDDCSVNEGCRYLEDEDEYFLQPASDFKWKVIASGLQSVEDTVGDYYENEVNAWEAVVVNGVLYLNNGKDLPLVFKEEWDVAHPLLELREHPAYRVAAVGTISEYSGFLMLADVHQVHTLDWEDLMKSQDPYGRVLDSDDNKSGNIRTIRSPYSLIWSYEGDGSRFGTALYGTMESGSNIFKSKYPIKRYDDGGYDIGNPHPLATFQPNQEVVIVGAGTEIATINGESIGGVLGYSSTSSGFSRIKVGRVDAGTAGGDDYIIVNDRGNPVNAESSITEDELAIPVTNSVTGYMMRLDSIGKLTSVADLVDDGSRIMKMKPLVDRLMIYRDTGYMTAIRVNTSDVFQFERRYTGSRVVDFRNTLIDVAGRYHMFMSFTGIYQTDRAASQPKLVMPMEKGFSFWENLSADEAERVFCTENTETKEIWFCTPKKTYAFDYVNLTVSEIDQVFTAGAQIIQPKTSKRIEYRWSVFALSDNLSNIKSLVDINASGLDPVLHLIVRYGHGPDGFRVFNRYGNPYRSVLQSGLIDFSDQFNDKDLRSYAVHVAENVLPGVPSDAEIKIRISTVPTAQSMVESIVDVELNEDGEYEFSSGERIEAESLLNKTLSENMIPLFLRSPYFRDAIIIDGKDNPVKLIGRTFEVSGSASKLTQMAPNQG